MRRIILRILTCLAFLLVVLPPPSLTVPISVRIGCLNYDSSGNCEEAQIEIKILEYAWSSDALRIEFIPKYSLKLDNNEDCSFYRLHPRYVGSYNVGFMSMCKAGSDIALIEGSLLTNNLQVNLIFGQKIYFLHIIF